MSLFPEIDEEIDQIQKAQAKKLQELKDKSEPYSPSNGTEGMWFEGEFCSTCSEDDVQKEKYCKSLGELQATGECADIIIHKGRVICIKHSSFNIKNYMGVEI